MKKTNISSAALCVCLCMLLASCGSQGIQSDTKKADEGTSSGNETTAAELTDGLEDADFNEADFNIVYSADQLGQSWPYDSETETGDLLNDSVYASDLNSDGKPSDGDIFGYTTPGETPSLMSRIVQSNGMLMATSDNDGVKLMTVSDRLQNSFERYYSLLYDGSKTYIGTVTGDKGSVEAFTNGNILFMHQTTLQLPKMRDTDVNFGIVPLPKYDEEQENYQSMLSSQLMLIPSNLDDEMKEYVGTITEALSYESWKTVTPAVYNSIFESKYLRDATSYEMYQIIRSSLVCDFNWNYGNGNELTNMAIKLIMKPGLYMYASTEELLKTARK